MSLEHVVVTSVARDDLPDGGAHIFAETIRAIRRHAPQTGVEVLIPDFNGSDEPLRTVMAAAPDILNHNVETVERLQKPVRKRARYQRSLDVRARAKVLARELSGRDGTVHTKSSVMVGLGETRDELRTTFSDLRAVDCDILTIGQYLRPSEHQLPLERYYLPAEFEEMKQEARALGFKHVESGPLVRSSYHARDQVPEDARSRRTAAQAALSANGIS
jgi:lipoic acid synthetase